MKLEPLQVLTERFGFSEFREGQEEIIDAVLARRNVLAVMPTGSGKSLCYQLPALLFPGVTVVVSPLIALMKDQVDALTRNGIAATLINSSLDFSEQQRRLQQVRSGEFKLIYVAPERFRNPRFMEGIQSCSVSLLAIDEAHCVSEWGHDFRPDYLRLKDAIARLQCPPVIALTATATPEVRRDIIDQLALQEPMNFVTGFDRPNLCFRVKEVYSEQEKLQAIFKLLSEGNRKGLIYAATRKNVEKVAGELCAAGFKAGSYHAGMELDARKSVQESFMHGSLPLVVATNAFGMGIDKADLRFIVHYDIPGSLEAYYQEVGRAGRDGHPAVCLLLFNFADTFTQEFFIEGSCPPLDLIQEVYQVLCELGTSEVEMTVRQLSERLARKKSHEMAISSALKLLEKAGYIERGTEGEHQAKLTLLSDADTLRKASSGSTQREVVDYCLDVLNAPLGKMVAVSLDEVASDLDLSDDQLKRTLSGLHRLGQMDYRPPFRGRGMTVLQRVPWRQLDVNYAAVERRSQFERRKLRRMVEFAYAQSCLRRFILEYFGESASHLHCQNCSKCHELGERDPVRTLSDEEVIVVKKCLSCVARMKSRFGKARVAQVLTGSKLKALEELELNKLSTYGLLRDFTQPEVLSVLDALVNGGLLEVFGTEYPVLRLTEKGRKGMLGHAPIQVLFPLKLNSEDEIQDPQSKTPFHTELFASLREMRRKWAEHWNLPPYVIFHDETLRGISRRLPKTLMELREIKGIGERKIDAYGAEVLRLVKKFKSSYPDAAPIPGARAKGSNP